MKKTVYTILFATALLFWHIGFAQENKKSPANRTWPQIEVERTFCVIDQNIQPVGIYLSVLLKSIIIKNES